VRAGAGLLQGGDSSAGGEPTQELRDKSEKEGQKEAVAADPTVTGLLEKMVKWWLNGKGRTRQGIQFTSMDSNDKKWPLYEKNEWRSKCF